MPPSELKLTALGYSDYDEYLKSVHWHRLRRVARAVLVYQCATCLSEDSGLHLHHKTYERLGNEEVTDLVWLCPTCHTDIHVLERRGLTTLDPDDMLGDPERAAITSAQRQAITEQQRAEYLELHGTKDIKKRASSLARRVRQHAHVLTTTGRVEELEAFLDTIQPLVEDLRR